MYSLPIDLQGFLLFKSSVGTILYDVKSSDLETLVDISVGEGRVSGLTHQASFCTVNISPGLSHVVALWQHAAAGKNAFPPQIILGTC